MLRRFLPSIKFGKSVVAPMNVTGLKQAFLVVLGLFLDLLYGSQDFGCFAFHASTKTMQSKMQSLPMDLVRKSRQPSLAGSGPRFCLAWTSFPSGRQLSMRVCP